MALDPKMDPGSSNPIYPFILLCKYRILVCQAGQYWCLAGEIATHIAKKHVGIDPSTRRQPVEEIGVIPGQQLGLNPPLLSVVNVSMSRWWPRRSSVLDWRVTGLFCSSQHFPQRRGRDGNHLTLAKAGVQHNTRIKFAAAEDQILDSHRRDMGQ